MLRAGVEPVDLPVGGVGDQRDFVDSDFPRELCPCLDGALGGLVASVCEVESSSGLVVGHRTLGFARP